MFSSTSGVVGFCFRLLFFVLVYLLYTLGGPDPVLLIHCPLYLSKKKVASAYIVEDLLSYV